MRRLKRPVRSLGQLVDMSAGKRIETSVGAMYVQEGVVKPSQAGVSMIQGVKRASSMQLSSKVISFRSSNTTSSL
jgi:hypothetical protein